MSTDPRFLDPLIIEDLDGVNFKVWSEFDYHTDISLPNGEVVHIHAGFLTDFASVPRIFWPLLPPNGRYGKAAVVHDFLYRTAGQATKSQADHVFLEAMKALGVNLLTRYIMFYGVRLFGHHAYKGGLL